MGWVESPPYFCTATETSHNIAMQYCKTEIETLKKHKFNALMSSNATLAELPEMYKMQKTMQCSATKKTQYPIPPAKRGTKTSIIPLQDTPP
jgi:hypothetical protein